ncbi:vitamin B12 ABC transporter ATP-binding protein BtuD [Vibrio aestuarianus]|uniref:vitamin B12 ABC transporter ATP-binding protein BtuD n=1 Tax=Vibrio aestuarianus TaxID=28171 RepID=UPI00237C9A46|nr:vitamin B12 ABC transporter ATP-binding protein BtuD [Vibrio aestuarianus]MDE1265428.1 vitamin B12 ABC transporter ATP-binding protein BtuD [Vibrio aestuarianus]MDE1297621.1 vitamin B12 ABC transporter ATP-binding protein BtuD [Vibrio aestuarianus]
MIHVNTLQVTSLQVGARLLPLSFRCKAGEVLHVIGPNGSGKSTLLAALAGVIESKGMVQIGDVNINEVSLETLSLHRAYLSQSDKPAFNLQVFQYLSLAIPSCAELHSEAVNQAVNDITHLLNIEDKLHRSIHQLSGGEWQRVRLAGICLQIWPSINPYAKLLILDEPSAPLDIAQEVLLYRLIEHIAQQGIVVIMANHDLNRTLRHADSALLLERGVLQSLGEVETVLSSERLSQVFQTQVKHVDVKGKPYLIFD